MSPAKIRFIQPEDDVQVATIIRQVMTEFGCVGDGYSISDPEVDQMFLSYQGDTAAFFVIELNEKVLGCGGFGPLVGAPEHTCELKKMYFLPELRGLGMGKKMLDKCIATATEYGYHHMYLETVDRMTAANGLYRRRGFHALDGPEGATGHSSCDAFYRLDLK
jgi:putative acetyltransferase